jgi:hypothetical protein
MFYEKDYLYSSAKDYSEEKGLVKIAARAIDERITW